MIHGIKCPQCDGGESHINDCRYSDRLNSFRRRRQCDHCGERFTTYEQRELPAGFVDGKRVSEALQLLETAVELLRNSPCNPHQVTTLGGIINRLHEEEVGPPAT